MSKPWMPRLWTSRPLHSDRAHEPVSLPALRGSDADLRAMKRALASAPLGPKAVLALTGAILALESDREAVSDSLQASSHQASPGQA